MIPELQIDEERIALMMAQLPPMQLALDLLQTLDTERAVDIDPRERCDELTDKKIVLAASILREGNPFGNGFGGWIAKMAGKRCDGIGRDR
jgi:hypothetical protein